MEADNFIPANPLVTPAHIQPEWYYLFAYAILRSIPNKLGGVIALLAAVAFLFVFSISSTTLIFRGMNFSPVARFVFWTFVANFFILTWLGACPAEEPFTGVSQVCSVLYFLLISSIATWSHVVTYLYLGNVSTNKSFSFNTVLNL
jgi:ubiquinol-cytochrome c reductase cytochrome b subunit